MATMKRGLLRALGAYQQYRQLQPPACRYLPTCSAYVIEAIETHGTIRGGFFGLRRVCRCHPLGGRGYDPVPAPRELRPRHA